MAPSLGSMIGRILGRVNACRCACGALQNNLKFANARCESSISATATATSCDLLKPLSQLSRLSKGVAAPKASGALAYVDGAKDWSGSWLQSLALLGLAGTWGANAVSSEGRQYAETRKEQVSGHGTFSEALHKKLVDIVGVSPIQCCDLKFALTRGCTYFHNTDSCVESQSNVHQPEDNLHFFSGQFNDFLVRSSIVCSVQNTGWQVANTAI
jgi:hypothetical protein